MSEDFDDSPSDEPEFDFVTNEVEGLNAYTFADRVKKRAHDLGLSGYADRPQLTEDHAGIFHDMHPGDYYNGRLPVVIRRLGLDQISALHSLTKGWFGYLTFQTSMVAAERAEALKQKEFLWSHVRKQYKYYEDPTDGKTKKRSDQQMSDHARADWRFVKANAQYTEVNTLHDILKASLEAADQDMKMVSREITIIQTKMMQDTQGGRPVGDTSQAFRNWKRDNDGSTDTPTRPKKNKTGGKKVIKVRGRRPR
jgi:hypothetical protein